MQSQLTTADRLAHAAIFAARCHAGVTRDDGQTPYAVHVFRVVEYLRTIAAESDADVLCAGFLHDTIEDSGVNFDEIAMAFNTRVAGFVAELTNDNRLPKHERRAAMLDHMHKLSPESKRVKLADRLDNVSDLLRGHGSLEKKRRYIGETRRILTACEASCPPLEAALRAALDELIKQVDSH
jgi:(p)ppGpp synthase/HD superfamily hydrolase